MEDDTLSETRDFWNRVAGDWQIQVGGEGDRNRLLNSDPVLWRFLGDVRGLEVLDAGCGTGYLSRKLHASGARVTGVDLSENMIAIARGESAQIDFRVDSCTRLTTLGDNLFDRLVSNYVLMDLPDLDGALRAFHRVLKPGGVAVLIFSHPCFPQGLAERSGETIHYEWPFPYFEERKMVDPPWGHFTSDFIWFHRPLSTYWKAFVSAGFTVVDLEEPRIMDDRASLARSEDELINARARPCSIAFKLRKVTDAR
jgi:ubiquinone/menaquinone biosynthesis C-methylase UbiE